ncbi:CsbD family protein [Mycolicibacterium sp. 018/SC-01/001]|uniref:microaggregate-binding protein 1 n=1 Tax=Mycolicibacterium sp. 018/SC-01/001 TaxID=2592069 RepID=UPI00117EB7BD|nr:CsbD family protein [Mycolicibacterium sp. 018/SC-01/001]TRW88003.1 CsbD family protein [Mycolicibacterium sp. 018/SC-01/001]
MADSTSGPIAALRALVDGSIGLSKQVIGILLDNDRLQEQGEAQQQKARALKDVAKKEAEAEAARAEAKTQEARQKAASKS